MTRAAGTSLWRDRGRLSQGRVAHRVAYSGYDIRLDAESAGWAAWIHHRDVPHGRVSGHGSVAAAITAAMQEIDRWEAPVRPPLSNVSAIQRRLSRT